MKLYFAEVHDCLETFLVRAEKISEAKQSVFDELTELYPPKRMKDLCLQPYRKKDIKLTEIKEDEWTGKNKNLFAVWGR